MSLSGPNTGTSPWRHRLIKVREVSTARRVGRTRVHIFICGRMSLSFFYTVFFLPLCALQIYKGRVCRLCQVCWFVNPCSENEFKLLFRMPPLGETNADCFSRNISPCRNVQGIYNTCNQSMIFFLKCPMIGHTHVCVCYHHSAKTHTAPLIQSPAHGTSCAHVRSNQNRLAAPHGRLTVFPIISRARRNLKTLLPSTISWGLC